MLKNRKNNDDHFNRISTIISDSEYLNEEESSKLTIILDYLKYLYEEEKSRSDNLNSGIKIYITFLTFILGATLFKLFGMESSSELHFFTNFGFLRHIVLVSLVCLVISFILAVTVIKIWRYEGLCDPDEFAKKAIAKENNEIFYLIIADHIVATEHNKNVNDKKAKTVYFSFIFFVLGFLSLFLGIIFTLILK